MRSKIIFFSEGKKHSRFTAIRIESILPIKSIPSSLKLPLISLLVLPITRQSEFSAKFLRFEIITYLSIILFFKLILVRILNKCSDYFFGIIIIKQIFCNLHISFWNNHFNQAFQLLNNFFSFKTNNIFYIWNPLLTNIGLSEIFYVHELAVLFRSNKSNRCSFFSSTACSADSVKI